MAWRSRPTGELILALLCLSLAVLQMFALYPEANEVALALTVLGIVAVVSCLRRPEATNVHRIMAVATLGIAVVLCALNGVACLP
jgi:hypothetical protein